MVVPAGKVGKEPGVAPWASAGEDSSSDAMIEGATTAAPPRAAAPFRKARLDGFLRSRSDIVTQPPPRRHPTPRSVSWAHANRHAQPKAVSEVCRSDPGCQVGGLPEVYLGIDLFHGRCYSRAGSSANRRARSS